MIFSHYYTYITRGLAVRNFKLTWLSAYKSRRYHINMINRLSADSGGQQNANKETGAEAFSVKSTTTPVTTVSPIVNQNMESVTSSGAGKTEDRNEVKLTANVKPDAKSNGEKTPLADSKIQIIPGLSDAIGKNCWTDCVKLLRTNIGVNSPEVKQLQYVKEYEHLMDIAFQKGYKDLIMLFIYNGYPIYEVVIGNESVGDPLLFLSIKYNILECTYVLLDKNVDVNCNTITGERPVHACAEKGNIDLMEILLSKGATLAVKDNHKRSVLHTAVKIHHYNMVKLLLEKEIDIDSKDKDGSSALHYAVLENQYDLVKLLLDNDADIDLQDNHGNTALHLSIRDGYDDIFTLLHERGASINSRNHSKQTPLIVAVLNRRTSIIKSLLNDPYCDREAEFTKCSNYGNYFTLNSFTALSYAHYYKYSDIIDLFDNHK